MKSVSAVFFTEEKNKHNELIKLIESTSNLFVCSYECDSWADVDFYSSKNALFIIDTIPETEDAEWILSKLCDDNIFSTVPVLFTNYEVLYDFEKRGFFATVCDVLPEIFDYSLARHRIDNVFEIYNSKQQIQNITKIHTKRILDQANKLKEQNSIIHSMNYELIEVLVAAIESRDLESGQHIKRIRHFTKVLTEAVANNCPEYNISKEAVEYIYYGSSVHDIGKIAIPDYVLLKPGRLTHDEFNIMKTHTTRGAKLLEMLDTVNSNDSEYFRYCKEICLNHHERWDGNGYPNGKSGDDIPVSAQIVSLCDCYDALTSERPYKKSYVHNEAVEMIFNGCCGVFSPQILKCFSLVLPEFNKICNDFRDREIVADDLPAQFIKDIGTQKDVDNDILLSDNVEDFILNSLGVVFEADLTDDTLSVVHGNFNEFFSVIPKNYSELIMSCKKICHPSDIGVFTRHLNLDNLAKMYKNGRTKIQVEFRFIAEDTERVVSGFIKLKGSKFHLTNIYGVFDSFSSKDYYNDINRTSVDIDGANGLKNEVALKNELNIIFSSSDKKGLFIYIDIDEMSMINTLFGYEYGNELIREFSFKLKSLSNSKISVARLKADRFVVYYDNIERQNEIIVFVEQLHNLLQKTYRTADMSGKFTVTMGISRFPEDGKTYRQLIHAAKYAARSGKISGKGTYSFFNDNMRSSAEFNLWDTDNNEKSESYEPRFSPVVNAVTGEIVSYDFLPFSSFEDEVPLTAEAFFEFNKNSKTAKNISMLSIKSILYILIGLKNQGYKVPSISVYSLFAADELSGLVHELKDFTAENNCDDLDVCILFPQDILENTTVRKLSTFSEAMAKMNFKIGLYLIGDRYIHNNCYIGNVFGRYVLTSKLYENSISTGKSFDLIAKELNILSRSVDDLSIPYELSEEIANDLHNAGLEDFNHTLPYIKGTNNLIKDYASRKKQIKQVSNKNIIKITEFDAKTYMIDCSKGKTGFIAWNIKDGKLAFNKNIDRIVGFDIISSIQSKSSFTLTDIFRPSDLERINELIDDAKSTLNNHQLPKIGIVSNNDFTEYIDYDAYLRCITDNDGVPSRLYFEITRTV